MLRANERENAWRMLCDAEHLSKYEYLRIVRAVYVKLYGICACVPCRARARSGCHLGVALVSPRSRARPDRRRFRLFERACYDSTRSEKTK